MTPSLLLFLFCLIGIPAMVLLILRAPVMVGNPFKNFSGGIKTYSPFGVNAGKTDKGVLHSPVPATDSIKRKIYEAIKQRIKKGK